MTTKQKSPLLRYMPAAGKRLEGFIERLPAMLDAVDEIGGNAGFTAHSKFALVAVAKHREALTYCFLDEQRGLPARIAQIEGDRYLPDKAKAQKAHDVLALEIPKQLAGPTRAVISRCRERIAELQAAKTQALKRHFRAVISDAEAAELRVLLAQMSPDERRKAITSDARPGGSGAYVAALGLAHPAVRAQLAEGTVIAREEHFQELLKEPEITDPKIRGEWDYFMAYASTVVTQQLEGLMGANSHSVDSIAALDQGLAKSWLEFRETLDFLSRPITEEPTNREAVPRWINADDKARFLAQEPEKVTEFDRRDAALREDLRIRRERAEIMGVPLEEVPDVGADPAFDERLAKRMLIQSQTAAMRLGVDLAVDEPAGDPAGEPQGAA
jgi:hypothetical protein